MIRTLGNPARVRSSAACSIEKLAPVSCPHYSDSPARKKDISQALCSRAPAFLSHQYLGREAGNLVALPSELFLTSERGQHCDPGEAGCPDAGGR